MSKEELDGKLGFLTRESTNEEVMKAAINFIHDEGFMIISTVKENGDPAARGIEVHYLDNTETLYIGLCPGKPMYTEMNRHRIIAGTSVKLTEGRLSESVRITAELEPISIEEHPEIYARYWELNPGTAALYRKALDHFRIFKLSKGQGRTFHMAGDDIVQNQLFSWGGWDKAPWAYEIKADECVGCGTCAERCMENVITVGDDGKAHIDHFQCLECGVCEEVCPVGAVSCSFNK